MAGFVLVYLKSPPNGVVSLLLWPPLMAVQVTWVYFRARIAFTRGSLGIRSEGLRIEDRGVLRRPLVVARSLGAGDETPNLLLVFDEPISTPPLRFYATALERAGDELAGLALCVEDPVAAEKAFAGWGVTRSLSEEEARSVAERRRVHG